MLFLVFKPQPKEKFSLNQWYPVVL